MSNQTFVQLLDWMEKHVDVVSLRDAQHLLRNGNPGRLAVFITFDDGYAENCEHAIPELLSRGLPFTYFVSTNFVQHGIPFGHDVELNQPLPPNSIDQIKEMADAGVDIGAHTRTHVDIGKVSSKQQLEDEILGSREDLETWTGREIPYFAFPYGQVQNMSEMAFDLIRRSGFSGYCSAFGGYNLPGEDAFHLRRFHADIELERMRNWLSLDPRWYWSSRSQKTQSDPQFEHPVEELAC